MNGKTKISAVFAVIVFIGILLFAWKLPQKTPSITHTENTMTVLQQEGSDRLSAGSLVVVADILSKNDARTIVFGQLRMAEQILKTTTENRNQLLVLLAVWFAWLLLPQITVRGLGDRLLQCRTTLWQNICYIHRGDGKKRIPVAAN